jgi:hypothetical protein
MVFLCSVVLGFNTKPLTMIRLFAELFGHYPKPSNSVRNSSRCAWWTVAFGFSAFPSFIGVVELNQENGTPIKTSCK